MPEAFVPDPNSPEAESAWRHNIETRLASLKQGSQIMAPGYAQSLANQLAIAFPDVALTGLTKTVVVGTRRLIRITGFVRFLALGGSVAELYVKEGTDYYGLANQSMANGEFATLVVVSVIIAPTQGTHTYYLSADSNPGNTINAIAAQITPNWLLVEDIGQAPA